MSARPRPTPKRCKFCRCVVKPDKAYCNRICKANHEAAELKRIAALQPKET